MRTLIVLLIIFLASLTTTYSQYINKQGHLLYEAGGQTYEYADMESVFQQDLYALNKYKKSLKRKKRFQKGHIGVSWRPYLEWLL